MVYRIIQMHDGEVEVQSTPGHGTTFRILLPRASEI
jgi:signal transduction histidine kinase